MKSAIIIPARYHSARFPGKPLAMIGEKTMLQRVCEIALEAAHQINGETSIMVATDDDRIMAHASEIGIQAILTSQNCRTGTDRILSAVKQLSRQPDFILNLQGDAPLTPPHFIEAVLNELLSNKKAQWVTPVTQLSWEALDQLREDKQTTPFSGTTAILDDQNHAIWFSKNIIPAIRNEAKLREKTPNSPIFRHIGLYGSTHEMLQTYTTLEQTPYEILEGLEQLRLLENGYRIHAVKVDYGDHPAMSGVDTPEDAKRAEALMLEYGIT